MIELICRFFSPFWLMKDASRGTFAERAAAYRHNRQMRGCLPIYVRRWLFSCAAALILTAFFEVLGETPDGSLSVFMIMAAAYAIFAAIGICAALLMTYIYFYLTYAKETSGSARET